MIRILTAILALLFTFGSAVAVPVPRIDTGRDSSSIVWIAGEETEQVRTAVKPEASRSIAPRPHYTSRLVSPTAVPTLFQRPPPVHA